MVVFSVLGFVVLLQYPHHGFLSIVFPFLIFNPPRFAVSVSPISDGWE